MKNEKKYWDDYTQFIKVVEAKSKEGPASLLEHYQHIVEGLEDGGLYSIFEQDEPCEIDNDEDALRRVISDVHHFLEDKVLNGNLLRNIFADKTYALDERLEKHIKEEYITNKEWHHHFTLKMVDWNKQ